MLISHEAKPNTPKVTADAAAKQAAKRFIFLLMMSPRCFQFFSIVHFSLRLSSLFYSKTPIYRIRHKRMKKHKTKKTGRRAKNARKKFGPQKLHNTESTKIRKKNKDAGTGAKVQIKKSASDENEVDFFRFYFIIYTFSPARMWANGPTTEKFSTQPPSITVYGRIRAPLLMRLLP